MAGGELNVAVTTAVLARQEPSVVDLACVLDVLSAVAHGLKDGTNTSHATTSLVLGQTCKSLPIVIEGKMYKLEHLEAVLKLDMEAASARLVLRAGLDVDDVDGIEAGLRCGRTERADTLESRAGDFDTHVFSSLIVVVTDKKSKVQTTRRR